MGGWDRTSDLPLLKTDACSTIKIHRKAHRFKGAPVSGGGTGVQDTTTGEWSAIDEQLVIG
jgi:2-phospho-L-lactate guanylyltransferase (CobY/MobA/RfbA family)